ncbi:MAG: hypothetical protein JO123_01155, partial [Ktedonobacteraceae bacterium]|nr:hypothetical protein [Ktedonobacteraceae bacterium]
MRTLISNATLVLPDRLVEGGWLLIEDGRIAALGEGTTCPNPSTIERSIDALRNFLMPGLIDLHSDAIEKLVEPRPNVLFDLDTALPEADWRLAGSGVTTEFHAVSLDDKEFGVRSDGFVLDLVQAIKDQAGSLLVRHKIHARLELSNEKGLDLIAEMIAHKEMDMLSL